MFTAEGELSARAPFDLSRATAFLGTFAPTFGEQALATAMLTKAVTIEDQTVLFRVHATGNVDYPGLRYELLSKRSITERVEATLRNRISHFLSLSDDLTSFYAIGNLDPIFTPVMKQLYGYHHVRFLTPFESSCWAILTQRTPISVARSMKRTLAAYFGNSYALDGVTYIAFPSPEQVADIDPVDLAALVGNERKAKYLQSAAIAFSTTDEHFLCTAPYETADSWLRQIPGIGEWSSAFILLRGLGRMERLPKEDRLRQEVLRRYGCTDIDHLAAPYGDYKGYWAHYLRVAAC